jgi:hypothetical protein
MADATLLATDLLLSYPAASGATAFDRLARSRAAAPAPEAVLMTALRQARSTPDPWMYQAGGRVGHTDGCARATTPGTSAQVWEAWVRATMVGAGSSRARRAGGGQKSLIRFKFRVYEGRCRYGHFSDKRHRAGYDDRR